MQEAFWNPVLANPIDESGVSETHLSSGFQAAHGDRGLMREIALHAIDDEVFFGNQPDDGKLSATCDVTSAGLSPADL